jgi:ketosteroid isomerase-like protein
VRILAVCAVGCTCVAALAPLAVPARRVCAKRYESTRLDVLRRNMQPLHSEAESEIDLLRAAYEAFNARDVDSALAVMSPNVTWPRAFKGGHVQGHDQVREYWTEQWSEIDPTALPTSFTTESSADETESTVIMVSVHQVVRDLAGSVLADETVGHRFLIQNGLIQTMDVYSLESDPEPIKDS